MQLPFNTVLMLIGPTNSGKSYFTELLKKEYQHNLVVLSSDDCRREIIGDSSISKYDPLMLQSSVNAFILLKTKLEAAMSFPMSLRTGLIVIDSTALNEGFRSEISNLCKKFQWKLAALVFDYSGGVSEYEKYSEIIDLDLIRSHLTRLRTKVRPTLRRSDFTAGVYTISSKDEITQTKISTDITPARALSLKLSKEDHSFLAVGDIHGCYQEFVDLLLKAGFLINDGKVTRSYDSPHHILLLGDLVDKGPKVRDIISLIYRSMKDEESDLFILITGNHDLFFHQWFAGERDDCSQEKRQNYYDSTLHLQNDEEGRSMMEYIYQRSYPYFFSKHVVATHAPCPVKYLGKDDPKSTSYQINLRFDRYKEENGSFEDFCRDVSNGSLSFMKDQNPTNWPFILSGHVQVDKPTRVGNQIMMDTGAVYGNSLSGVVIDGSKYQLLSIPSAASYAEGRVLSLFKRSPLEGIELTPNESRRLKAMTSFCPVNFISPTISPASSNRDSNTLESITEALSLFKIEGLNEVVIQTKFMGSRSQFYLVRGEAPDKRPGVYQFDHCYCYWISRNGFLIRQDLKDLSMSMVRTFFKEGVDLLILDGELMPWSLLGSGLISDLYWPVVYEMKELMKDLDLMGAREVLDEYREEALRTDFSRMSKEEASNLYKPHQFKAIQSSLRLQKVLPSASDMQTNLEIFERQIQLYGDNSEPFFKPFSLLKIKVDGDKEEQVLPNNNWVDGLMLGDDHCIKISTDDAQSAIEFFNRSQERGDEGVMVKPLQYDHPLPGLKVRNEQYLTLVYGPNYRMEANYRRHVLSKDIRGKLRASKSQYQMGKELLAIPYSKLSSEKAKEIIFCLIQEDRHHLDPRL